MSREIPFLTILSKFQISQIIRCCWKKKKLTIFGLPILYLFNEWVLGLPTYFVKKIILGNYALILGWLSLLFTMLNIVTQNEMNRGGGNRHIPVVIVRREITRKRIGKATNDNSLSNMRSKEESFTRTRRSALVVLKELTCLTYISQL